MKKVIQIAFILIFILSMVVLPQSLFVFQPALATDSELTFKVGQRQALQGSTVTVPVSVEGNGSPGFAAVGLMISYNADLLELTLVEAAQTPQLTLNPNWTLTTIQGTQWISLINTGNPMDWAGNGPIANLTFKVAQNATPGITDIAIAFTAAADGTPTTKSGTVLTGAQFEFGSIIILATEDGTDPNPSPSPGGPGTSPSPGGPGTSPSPGGPGTSPSPGGPGTSPSPSPGGPGSSPSPSPGGPGSNNPGFGNVPQTGVFDITGTAIAMCLSILLTVYLSICLFLHVRAKRRRTKSDSRHGK